MTEQGKRRAITLKDVAREAEVSVSTASMALRGIKIGVKRGVSVETAEIVEEVAGRLGYVRNQAAVEVRKSENRITGKEVAEAAGVSETTVSNALNAPPGKVRVSSKTTERIRQIAQELGYEPLTPVRSRKNRQNIMEQPSETP